MSSYSSKRPLSPHLQVYKPQMTSGLSIFHRITGFKLSAALVPLAIWLYLAAYDAAGLEVFYEYASSWIGLLFLAGWSFAFYYHLMNGVRHLFWDAGKLLEIEDATRAGYLVLGGTLGLTAVTWGYLLMGGAL
jgi:succinate dehydrogenase / fumarate reductase cytochrome b subunit